MRLPTFPPRATLLACGLAAGCGLGEGAQTPPPERTTVAVNLRVDDRANRVYGAGELAWRGSMSYDATFREVVRDATWSGPFPILEDDGPWDAGGHEPLGSTAGDHVLGTTVFVRPPATGSLVFWYGLTEELPDGGFLWLWRGPNGTFRVAAGQTAPVDAQGLTFPAFGDVDLEVRLDLGALAGGPWDTSTVAIQGTFTGWYDVALLDSGTLGDAVAGDGVVTFLLSERAGAPPFEHLGLLASGDVAELGFILGDARYRNGDGSESLAGGVAVRARKAAGPWVDLAFGTGLDGYTTVVVP